MKLFIFLVLVLLISLLITYIGDVIKNSKEPAASVNVDEPARKTSDAPTVLNFKKWVFPYSIYPNWHRIWKNGYSIKMANTGITLPTSRFSISFMYKLTAQNNEYNNIVHITNTGGDDIRCPGIWVRPNETNLHLNHTPSSIDSFEGVPLNTVAFFTFIFNYDIIEFYVNGVKRTINFNSGGVLYKITPEATMYIGNPFHSSNGTIQIQDFTIYDGILTLDQITTIYNESMPTGRKKTESDILDAQLKFANEQRAVQRSSQIASTLKILDTQLKITPTFDSSEIANIKNRILQYQNMK